MRKRRVLSCVLSAFIICSITCGPISVSATYNTLDDMEIDPWGDLSDIQDYVAPTPELAPDDFDPVTMFPDMGIYDLNQYATWTVTLSDSFTVRVYRSNGYSGYTAEANTYTFLDSYQFQPFKEVDSSVTCNGAMFLANDTEFTVKCKAANDYSSGEYVLNGTVKSSLYAKIANDSGESQFIERFPYQFDVVADNLILGTFAFNEEGTYTFDDYKIDLNNDVTTIGYVFYYPVSEAGEKVTFDVTGKYFSCGHYLVDDLSLSTYDQSIGLLEGIIDWLKSIRDSIVELPQNIANFILEGLQGLFIPDQEELTGLMDKYDVLFEERLGFIYQMFSFVVDSFTTWIETMKSAQDYSFTFPGISFPYDGEIIEIVPEQEVSLDNAVMDVLRPVLGTIVSIVCVLAFTNTCFDLVIALMSGQSYIEFIGRKREELDV